MRKLSLSFETVVWIISIRCVLELTYGKSSILIFFSGIYTEEASPDENNALFISERHCFMDLMTGFHLPVVVA